MGATAGAEGGPRYRVIGRPGPWLAAITDRRTGATDLWTRTLRGGQGRHSHGRHVTCANCGQDLFGPFYRPQQRKEPIAARLCLACVEGDGR